MWDSSNSLFFCMVSDFCGTKPDLIEFDFFYVVVSRWDTDANVSIVAML